MRERSRSGPWLAGVLAITLAGAAGMAGAARADEAKETKKTAGETKPAKTTPPTPLEEIKETQKQILERLDAQDKVLKDIQQRMQAPPQAQAPARPQMDPNKVYTIPVGNVPVRGNKDAPVTVVEFSDYQ